MARFLRNDPTDDDITLFTQELSWMIGAGVPLGRAIHLLADEGLQSRLHPVLIAVRAELRSGASLADALKRQGTVFPEAYQSLVSLAEGTGTMPMVLRRLHAGRAQAQALKRKLSSALVYPAFLLLVALASVALIGLAVVPQMRDVLPPVPRPDGADAAMRRLIDVSDWVALHALKVGLIVALTMAAIGFFIRHTAVQRILTDLATYVPVLGTLILTARLAEMTRSLAMLAEAGLPLAEALRLTRRSTVAGDLARVLEAMENALRAGQDVTQPLIAARGVPPLLSSLIRVGQETGNMARSLSQAADVFEEKTRIALDRALVLLEPTIILLISVGVGALVYTVIGALMSVNDMFV